MFQPQASALQSRGMSVNSKFIVSAVIMAVKVIHLLAKWGRHSTRTTPGTRKARGRGAWAVKVIRVALRNCVSAAAAVTTTTAATVTATAAANCFH